MCVCVLFHGGATGVQYEAICIVTKIYAGRRHFLSTAGGRGINRVRHSREEVLECMSDTVGNTGMDVILPAICFSTAYPVSGCDKGYYLS